MLDRPAPRNSRFVTALFLMVFLAALLLMVRLLAVYFAAIVLGLALVVLSSPLHAHLHRRFPKRRTLTAAITTLVIVLLVLVPVLLVLTSLSAEAVSLYNRAGAGEEPLVAQLMAVLSSEHPLVVAARDLAATVGLDLSPNALRSHASEAGAAFAATLYEQLRGIATNLLRTLMHFGLMVVVIMALLMEGPRLKAYILDLSPLPNHQEEMLVQRFAAISRAVFLGNGVASALQGVCGGLAFWFFSVGSPVLWGAAIAFFAFLPIVGASVVWVPAALYMVVQGQVGTAIGFSIFNIVYVMILEYGLKPRLIGEQSRMSGALVFVGIISGLSLFGILGLFYGPLVLTMFLSLAEIYKAEYRDDLMAVHSPWVAADADGARQIARQRPSSTPVPRAVTQEVPAAVREEVPAAMNEGVALPSLED